MCWPGQKGKPQAYLHNDTDTTYAFHGVVMSYVHSLVFVLEATEALSDTPVIKVSLPCILIWDVLPIAAALCNKRVYNECV